MGRFAIFSAALAAFGGIVAADVFAAETDDEDVEALELQLDDAAEAAPVFARTTLIPDEVAAPTPPPPEPEAAPAPKPKPKKRRRKKMLKFGRMDAY